MNVNFADATIASIADVIGANDASMARRGFVCSCLAALAVSLLLFSGHWVADFLLILNYTLILS